MNKKVFKKKFVIGLFLTVIILLAFWFAFGKKIVRSYGETPTEPVPGGQPQIVPTMEIPKINDPVELEYQIQWLPEEEVDALYQP